MRVAQLKQWNSKSMQAANAANAANAATQLYSYATMQSLYFYLWLFSGQIKAERLNIFNKIFLANAILNNNKYFL